MTMPLRPLPLRAACLATGALLAVTAAAAPVLKLGAGAAGAGSAAPALLPVDRAFSVVEARATPAKGTKGSDKLAVSFDIAPGYFLYRSRLSIEDAGTPAQVLPKPKLPTGTFHEDPDFGRVEIYSGVPLVASLELPAGATAPKRLRVRYQGCAEAGVCYPPQTRVVDVVRR